MDEEMTAILDNIEKVITDIDRQISRLNIAQASFGLLINSGAGGACYFESKKWGLRDAQEELRKTKNKLSALFHLAPIAEVELPK